MHGFFSRGAAQIALQSHYNTGFTAFVSPTLRRLPAPPRRPMAAIFHLPVWISPQAEVDPGCRRTLSIWISTF